MKKTICIILTIAIASAFLLNGCGWKDRIQQEIIMERLEEMGDE